MERSQGRRQVLSIQRGQAPRGTRVPVRSSTVGGRSHGADPGPQQWLHGGRGSIEGGGQPSPRQPGPPLLPQTSAAMKAGRKEGRVTDPLFR